MSERTLITGGNGFLGSYVARALLDRGHEICTYDLTERTAEASAVLGDSERLVLAERGSIDDRSRLTEVVSRFAPRYVVHMAGVIDPLRLLREPLLAVDVNIAGTASALEASRSAGVELFVYISSIGVLPKVCYEPIDSDHPTILADRGPATGPYGAAKLAGEALCLAYDQELGLPARVVRPSALYGFGMRSHSANYVKNLIEPALRGEPVQLPSGGSLTRDYTHVTDAAELVVALIGHPEATDRVFYAATGEELVSAARVAELVRELVPGAEISIGMGIGDEDAIEAGFRGRLSIDNARSQLGWSPAFPDVSEGLAEYARRYADFIGGDAPGRLRAQ